MIDSSTPTVSILLGNDSLCLTFLCSLLNYQFKQCVLNFCKQKVELVTFYIFFFFQTDRCQPEKAPGCVFTKVFQSKMIQRKMFPFSSPSSGFSQIVRHLVYIC